MENWYSIFNVSTRKGQFVKLKFKHSHDLYIQVDRDFRWFQICGIGVPTKSTKIKHSQNEMIQQ